MIQIYNLFFLILLVPIFCISLVFGAPQEVTTNETMTENKKDDDLHPIVETPIETTVQPQTISKLVETPVETTIQPQTTSKSVEPITVTDNIPTSTITPIKITTLTPNEISMMEKLSDNTAVHPIEETVIVTTQEPLHNKQKPSSSYPTSTNNSPIHLAEIKENIFQKDQEGGYFYSFTGSDGTKRYERGSLKDLPNEDATGSEKTVTSEGSYSYISPDGRLYEAHYKADENGFSVNITFVSTEKT